MRAPKRGVHACACGVWRVDGSISQSHQSWHGAGKVSAQAFNKQPKRAPPCVGGKVRRITHVRRWHPGRGVAQMRLVRHRPNQQLHHVCGAQLLSGDPFVPHGALLAIALLFRLEPSDAVRPERRASDQLVRVLWR